jgi:hypothetical protein
MKRTPHTWLWIDSGLACPIAMSLDMRARGGPQDTRPANCHNTAAVPKPPRTPDAAHARAKR